MFSQTIEDIRRGSPFRIAAGPKDSLAGEKNAAIAALIATDSIIVPKTWKNMDVTRLVETEEVVSSGKLTLNVPKCSMARVVIEGRSLE